MRIRCGPRRRDALFLGVSYRTLVRQGYKFWNLREKICMGVCNRSLFSNLDTLKRMELIVIGNFHLSSKDGIYCQCCLRFCDRLTCCLQTYQGLNNTRLCLPKSLVYASIYRIVIRNKSCFSKLTKSKIVGLQQSGARGRKDRGGRQILLIGSSEHWSDALTT